MKKTIRPTYPKEFSIGVLLLTFIVTCFLAEQVFVSSIHELKNNLRDLIGIGLIGCAVVMMLLIMWEEILFPVKLKTTHGGIVFRNRKTKLKVQILLYSLMVAIFVYVYLNFEVNLIRYIFWAIFCLVPPVVEKIFTGINNFKDYLELTRESIDYKNNEKEGHYKIDTIKHIDIITDVTTFKKKIELTFKDNTTITIDLDEMELEEFYDSITKFINSHYKELLK